MLFTLRNPLQIRLGRFKKWGVAGLLATLASLASMDAAAQPAVQNLPPEVDALLARAKVPREALACAGPQADP